MDVKVKLSFADYKDFSNSYMLNKFKKYKKLVIGGILIYISIFIAVLITMLYFNTEPLKGVSKPVGFPFSIFNPLIFVILVVFFFVIIYKKQMKKYYDSNKILQQEQTYTFSNEYLIETSQDSNIKISWDKVDRVEAYKSCYAIFTSTVQAFIIPKRCFENDIQMVEFEKILKNTQCKIIET